MNLATPLIQGKFNSFLLNLHFVELSVEIYFRPVATIQNYGGGGSSPLAPPVTLPLQPEHIVQY